MAYGEGWEVHVSEEFQSQLDELTRADDRLDERVEGVIFTAYRGPEAIWPKGHMVANLWCTLILSPLPFLIFYELSEEDRRIEFVIITEAP